MKKKSQKEEEEEEESVFDMDSLLHMKLFTFLQSHNRGATLIVTKPTTADVYRPKLTELHPNLVKRKEGEPLVQSVRVLTAEDLQEVVRLTEETRLDSSFTLAHTSIEIGDAVKEKKKKKKLRELDEAIAKIYSGISINGMMIVIFSGNEDGSKNGACMVRINKPPSTV